MTSLQRSTLAAADCEVAFDDLTRRLYATDASLYQLEPVAVAFPRSARQASSVITAASDAGVSITPRGAGTGLSGGAIGDGLIVEFSRYNRQITDLNLEARTVRTGAGVVLDQLNAFLKPHGFCFGGIEDRSASARERSWPGLLRLRRGSDASHGRVTRSQAISHRTHRPSFVRSNEGPTEFRSRTAVTRTG